MNKDVEANEQHQDDVEAKREVWLRDYIKSTFPDFSAHPEFQIYLNARKHYLSFPPLNECTRVKSTAKLVTGWEVEISFFEQVEIALLAGMLDEFLGMPAEQMARKIEEIKSKAGQLEYTAEQYAQMFVEDYQYNMDRCLGYSLKAFADVQWQITQICWWFTARAVVLKTLQDLRGELRWGKKPSLSSIRDGILDTARKAFDDIVGKMPTGPIPDYWGFILRSAAAIDSLVIEAKAAERPIRFTKERLAEKMGISDAALKQQLDKYGIKWSEVLQYHKRKGKELGTANSLLDNPDQ